MQLVEVLRNNGRDVRDFLHLPFRLYQHNSQWVPPLMHGERARFRPDFNFYQHSEAAFLLVRDDAGQAIGRIAVQNNRPFNEYRGQRNALIYLYEAVDNDDTARLLFGAATDWARAHKLERLLGPKGFLTGDGLGLLVEGFEHRPAIGIPYNHPYYVRQWEEVGGFTKVMDWLSALITREGYEYPPEVREIANKIRERSGFYVPIFKTRGELRRHLAGLRRAYNSAFASLWAYTPIPDGELEESFNRLFLITEPSMVKLVFLGEDVIGFHLAFPDISAALQRQKGELWPFGWIDLLLEKRRTKWVDFFANGIMPQYQGRGANAIIYDELAKTMLDSRYDYGELIQVQETNFKMLGDLERLVPLKIAKRHRVYERPVE